MIKLFFVLLSALLTLLAYYPHYLSGWVVVVSLVPFVFILIRSGSLLQNIAFCAIWGVIVFGAGLMPVLALHPLTWIGINIVFSGIMLFLTWLVFTAYFTAFLVGLGAVIYLFRQNLLLLLLSVPIGWGVIDYLHSLGPLGLTIHSLAMTQLDTPFSYLASVGGLELVSVVIVLINTAVAILAVLTTTRQYEENIRHNPAGKGFITGITAAAGVSGLLIALTYSTWFASWQAHNALSEPVIHVSCLQTDIIQETKWSPEMANLITNQLYSLTKGVPAGTVLAISPETALPMGLQYNRDLLPLFTSVAASNSTAYLMGSAEIDDGYRNRANLITWVGSVGHYDKDKLVVFGEYTPLREYIPAFLSKLVLGGDDFVSGGHRQEPLRVPGQNISIATMICLESLYLDEPIYQISRGANIIAIMTNDAWYKGSSAAYRHMEVARYHALAHHRSVMFVSNRGPAAIIPANGQFSTSEPLDSLILSGNITVSDKTTLYDMFGHYTGAIILYIFIFILLYRYIVRYFILFTGEIRKYIATFYSDIRKLDFEMKKKKLHEQKWDRKRSLWGHLRKYIRINTRKKFIHTKVNKNRWKNKNENSRITGRNIRRSRSLKKKR